MAKSFDVFLGHNSKDKPAVRELAEALRVRGLKVWLDEWELVPGRPWQEALEEVIETTGASAVLVGKDGLGPWQDKEMRGCLSEFVDRDLPVIPVLLPGAPEVPRLPIFLKGFTWVDLRGGLTEEGLDRVQWGVTGSRPDRSKPSSILTAAPEAGVGVAVAEVQPASAKVRPVQPDGEEPKAVVQEQPIQKAWTRWGALAWIGLFTLLGIAVFLLQQYSSKPHIDRPVQDDLETDTPGNREPTSRNAVPPLTRATAIKPAGTTLKACAPGEEREEAGIVYVRICPGTFMMGSADGDPRADKNEKPAHQVTLSEFWLGKTEVTYEQYHRFRKDHKGEPGLPATNVSWWDAKGACDYFGGRLPTEAEWEYAARAGSQTAWSFGDDEKRLGEYAWYVENSLDDYTAELAGTRKPNAWGLYDMHGNVLEWVADRYGPYSNVAQIDPSGPKTGKLRVMRGGAFSYFASQLRSASRYEGDAGVRFGLFGFRCALDFR